MFTAGSAAVGSAMNPRIKTWCGVPLHFSDGSMGVLALADMEHEFAVTKTQFELVQVLAQEAAGAVENARLFKGNSGAPATWHCSMNWGAKPVRF